MKSHKIFKEKKSRSSRASIHCARIQEAMVWWETARIKTDMFFVDDSKSRRLARCDKIQFNTAGKREANTYFSLIRTVSQSMWNKLITVRFRWKDCGAFLRAVRIYTHTCPLCSCWSPSRCCRHFGVIHRMIIKPIEYRIRPLDSHPPDLSKRVDDSA